MPEIHPALVVAGLLLAVGVLGTLVSIRRTERQVLGGKKGGRRADRISCLEAFEKLRFLDSEFSIALFEDFLTGLYLEAHRRRGDAPALSRLDAHLSAGVREALAARAPAGTRVDELHLGGLRYLDFAGLLDPEASAVDLSVEITAFGREVIPRRPDRDLFLRERWVLRRAKTARTPRPSQIDVDTCPCCHAPRTEETQGHCAHCGNQVDTGEFDWVVTSAEVLQQGRRPPRPSLSDQRVSLLTARQADLEEREGQIDLPGLRTISGELLATLQTAWSSGDTEPLRPSLSEPARQNIEYWFDALRRRREHFPLLDAELQGIELAATTLDRWFTSATVRIYAVVPRERLDARRSMFSFAPAAYSAYWTFIRGRFPGPRREDACPWCAAPLEIVREAVCEHCGAVVDKRAFGWLLSRIESVPAYNGQWSFTDTIFE